VDYYAIEDADMSQKFEVAADSVIAGVRIVEAVAYLELDRDGRMREAIILAVYSPAFS